jgi:hypothetical protein
MILDWLLALTRLSYFKIELSAYTQIVVRYCNTTAAIDCRSFDAVKPVLLNKTYKQTNKQTNKLRGC